MSSALPAVPDSIGFQVGGLQLYTDVDPIAGLHYLQCNRCSEVITLAVTGDPQNFIRHQEGDSCPRLAKSRGLSHLAFDRPSRLHVPAFSTAPSSLFSEGPSARLPAIISSFSCNCPLCTQSVSQQPQTIWKYNAIHHLLISHSEKDPLQPRKYKEPHIPGDPITNMFIHKDEEPLL